MRASAVFATLLATFTLPAASAPASDISSRQTKGKFCEKVSPAPPDAEIKARHDKFVDAFLVKKDVVEAFTYIAPEYIVCAVLFPPRVTYLMRGDSQR